MKENNYDFRKRLLEVHKSNRRDYRKSSCQDEAVINEDWTILFSENAGRLINNAAKDLQDYLFVSMGVSVRIGRVKDIAHEYVHGISKIILSIGHELQEAGEGLDTPRSYKILNTESCITVCGFDEKGTAQGCYYLEDVMNLRSAPFVKKGTVMRKPVFSPRMVHSGYGLDMYPDAYLNCIAHYGMDSILVFAKDADMTPHGYLDFNELVYRAAGFGLDVYAYSYLKSTMHPDDPGAEAYYDGTYGKLFKKCPGMKGIVLVGESVEFPSRDPETTGRPYYEKPADGLPSVKPSPGWWPCKDYPQWLDMIKKVVRKNNPQADIVFWTYNWGYVESEKRIELLKHIPADISLLVTFEMFEKIKKENVTVNCVDYTLSFEGPGKYFISEAEIAHERGIRLYTMCNTGGMTWDIGVIPYEPAPYQWIKRHDALLTSKDKYGLSGLMESHHYGWWPSFVSEIAKWVYWTPSPFSGDICRMIAERDFGGENTDMVLEAWKAWSEGIRNYIPANEDQYGPFRIGPSYPLVFRHNVTIPGVPYAMFGGNTICFTDYSNIDDYRTSLFQHKLPVEIRSLQRMEECFAHGVECMQKVYDALSEGNSADAFYLLNLGKFIINCIRTTINVKKWYTLKCRLLIETDMDNINEIIDRMTDIGRNEIRNAEDTIPIVEADSRLGWEPSMEYMTDTCHLQWKIKQVRYVLEKELRDYKAALKYS